jgi:hypothetical protein
MYYNIIIFFFKHFFLEKYTTLYLIKIYNILLLHYFLSLKIANYLYTNA